MPPGRSVQRGFVRDVGMTPSKADKPRKTAATPLVEKISSAEEKQQAALETLKAGYPELYEHTQKAALRVGVAADKKISWMITFMKNVIKQVEEQKRKDQLLADNKRRREQRATP